MYDRVEQETNAYLNEYTAGQNQLENLENEFDQDFPEKYILLQNDEFCGFDTILESFNYIATAGDFEIGIQEFINEIIDTLKDEKIIDNETTSQEVTRNLVTDSNLREEICEFLAPWDIDEIVQSADANFLSHDKAREYYVKNMQML